MDHRPSLTRMSRCVSIALTLVTAMLVVPSTASATVTLVQTSDPGYYNNHIGTVLNLSNPGGDTVLQPFPVNDDSHATFPTAPDLSAASGILGNWLTVPQSLNSNWSATPIAVPNMWAIGTEVAVIYQFDTLGATDVNALFGVDNGVFAWLDGKYLFGARDPGGVVLGEYALSLGDLAAGTHYLELILEDHGVTNGYAVDITAATFIPALPSAIPEPASLALLGVGLVGIGLARKKSTGATTRLRGAHN